MNPAAEYGKLVAYWPTGLYAFTASSGKVTAWVIRTEKGIIRKNTNTIPNWKKSFGFTAKITGWEKVSEL